MKRVERKKCNGECQCSYPATIEFFHKAATNKDGLSNFCKKCRTKQVMRAKKESEKKEQSTPPDISWSGCCDMYFWAAT